METTQLATFFNRIKKGSIKYRKIISNKSFCLDNKKGLRKQLGLSTLAQPLELRDRNFYNMFRCSSFTNKFRKFTSKFNSGMLYMNAMIANFVLDHDPTCAQCSGVNLLPAPRETLAHIFVDCPMISNILSKLNKLISNNALDSG